MGSGTARTWPEPPFSPHGLAAGPGLPPALPAGFPDLRAEGGHQHKAECSGAPLREASTGQMQTLSSLTLLHEVPLDLAVTGDGGWVWGPSEEPHSFLWPEGLKQASTPLLCPCLDTLEPFLKMAITRRVSPEVSAGSDGSGLVWSVFLGCPQWNWDLSEPSFCWRIYLMPDDQST